MLSAPENYRIYFTLDGSIPTTNSLEYRKKGGIILKEQNSVLAANADKVFFNRDDYKATGSFPKAEVVRAIAVAPDNTVGAVVTNTYFFERMPTDIPVLSIIMNYDDLIDYDTGIMAKGSIYDEWIKSDLGKSSLEANTMWFAQGNFSQHGKNWERFPVCLQIFENGGMIESNAGIRLHGEISRFSTQKGFNIYFRKEYGEKTLEYKLFPQLKDTMGNTISSYKSFVLRNGGNDLDSLKFRDAFMQKMASGLNLVTSVSRPVIVYINGEYYGIETIQEKYSDVDFANRFNIDKDNVILIKEDNLEEGLDEDLILYQELLAFADKDLRDPTVYAQFETIMDTQSMADYFALQIYIGNGDWKGMNKNTSLWRVRTAENGQDGKWRFIFYDTEFSAGMLGKVYTSAEYDNFTEALNNYPLFKAALENAKFQRLFLESEENVASIFTKNNYISILNTFVNEYKPYMPDFYARFGDTSQAWDNNINAINYFFDNRYASIVPIIKAYFDR